MVSIFYGGKTSFFRAKILSVNTWRSGPDICSLICALVALTFFSPIQFFQNLKFSQNYLLLFQLPLLASTSGDILEVFLVKHSLVCNQLGRFSFSSKTFRSEDKNQRSTSPSRHLLGQVTQVVSVFFSSFFLKITKCVLSLLCFKPEFWILYYSKRLWFMHLFNVSNIGII